MYNNIRHPITNELININSLKGRNILSGYINILGGYSKRSRSEDEGPHKKQRNDRTRTVNISTLDGQSKQIELPYNENNIDGLKNKLSKVYGYEPNQFDITNTETEKKIFRIDNSLDTLNIIVIIIPDDDKYKVKKMNGLFEIYGDEDYWEDYWYDVKQTSHDMEVDSLIETKYNKKNGKLTKYSIKDAGNDWYLWVGLQIDKYKVNKFFDYLIEYFNRDETKLEIPEYLVDNIMDETLKNKINSMINKGIITQTKEHIHVYDNDSDYIIEHQK
jgi:hypothetical protein